MRHNVVVMMLSWRGRCSSMMRCAPSCFASTAVLYNVAQRSFMASTSCGACVPAGAHCRVALTQERMRAAAFGKSATLLWHVLLTPVKTLQRRDYLETVH